MASLKVYDVVRHRESGICGTIIGAQSGRHSRAVTMRVCLADLDRCPADLQTLVRGHEDEFDLLASPAPLNSRRLERLEALESPAWDAVLELEKAPGGVRPCVATDLRQALERVVEQEMVDAQMGNVTGNVSETKRIDYRQFVPPADPRADLNAVLLAIGEREYRRRVLDSEIGQLCERAYQINVDAAKAAQAGDEPAKEQA